MKHYLIVYDRSAGRLLQDVIEFPERNEAMTARREFERANRGTPHIEIVLLGAESREQAETTHSRYFRGLEELASPA